MFKKLPSVEKNLNNQSRSGSIKTLDSVILLKAIDTNTVSNPRRVSGELHIS